MFKRKLRVRTTPIAALTSVSACVTGLVARQVAFASGSSSPFANPSWAVEQVEYIARQQLSDGAILFRSNEIEPYFANLTAIGLADVNTPESNKVVLQWMGWYVSHLNSGSDNNPDGLPGTIYDYRYNPSTGVEINRHSMDSVDSYAATFLSLAQAAFQTRDSNLQAFVSNHVAALEKIAHLLVKQEGSGGVRLSNNLDVAKPSYRVAFTMDNAEVYRGLSDFATLENALGRTSQGKMYTCAATATQTAISNKMWDSASQIWDWYAGMPVSPKKFYPGAAVQLWPILNGVVAPSSPYAKHAWAAFTAAWPKWMNNQVGDEFPDTYIARASELMGDNADAMTLLTTIYNKYAPKWRWPWFNDEAGWFIRAGRIISPTSYVAG